MKQLLSKIEALFNQGEIIAGNFKDVKSLDGSLLLRITPDIAVGATVQVVNEDGTLTNPNASEIDIEGSTLVLDADGKITAINPPSNDEEMNKPEDANVNAPSTGSENYSARFEAIETKVAELFTALNKLVALAEQNLGNMQKINAENSQLKNENIELSKKASAPAATFKKTEVPNVEIIITNPKQEKLARLKELRESIKNK